MNIKKKKLFNVSNRFDTKNNYIWELHLRLTSNIIIICIYNIKIIL